MRFAAGEIVKGTIIEVRPREVLVDIGYKSEGAITAGEFQDIEKVKVGDVIDVDGVDFAARAARCFPGLKPPAPVLSSLEDAIQFASGSAAGVDGLGSPERYREVAQRSAARLKTRGAHESRKRLYSTLTRCLYVNYSERGPSSG